MVYLPHWPIPSNFGNAQIDFESVFFRLTKILEKLNNPHKKLAPVIHITGTNGKGSVSFFLANILAQNNLKVNLYTSPHLHNCNERIVIDGKEISDSYLYEIIEEIRIATKETPITMFEALTLAAFLAFAKSNSDVNIIEVGMGARIDATNIIEEKEATIITPISFDHQEFLGRKIEQIAFEKAFIMRKNTNLILGPQPNQAQKIIEIMAQDQNANLIRFDKEFFIEIDEENKNFDFFMDLNSQKIHLENLEKPSMQGQHQYINSSISIACALSLKNFNITKNSIENALKSTFVKSRLEKINNNFLKYFDKNSEIFIDGAHNVSGAFALRNWFIEEIKNDKKNKINRKNCVILGFTKNKCRQEFLLQFQEVADEIIAITVDGEPNPESSEVIFEIGKSCNLEIKKENDLLDAIFYLSKKYHAQEVRIVICGSLHLARDVKKFEKFEIKL